MKITMQVTYEKKNTIKMSYFSYYDSATHQNKKI